MSTNDVEPVLLSIVEKGSVLQFNEYVNAVNYDVVLRTKLSEGETPPQQCDIWVAKFSAVTNSQWIVKNTAPYAVRVLYKKSYTCKNKKCNAKINIIFKKNNRNTRKNDPLLAKGLTAVIKVIFKHNHEVYCPALNFQSNQNVETRFKSPIQKNCNHYQNPSPIAIKCKEENYFTATNEENDTDDRNATSEALELVNLPINGMDSKDHIEITRFKSELQRISNIVEDAKALELTENLKDVNSVLEMIHTPQQFYEQFAKILN